MSDNLTPRLKNVFIKARKEAASTGIGEVGLEHTLLAILDIRDSIAPLKAVKLDVGALKATLLGLNIVSEKSTLAAADLPMTKQVENCLVDAKKISEKYTHAYIGTEHFLMAMLSLSTEECRAVWALAHHGVDPIALSEALDREMLASVTPSPQKVTAGEGGEIIGDKVGESYISRFAIDLTERARKGELDPVIGRDKEVTRVIRILSRKKKNNPVLVGHAGVGKTSIVEGLALRIVEKKVPTQLLAKRVFALDFALIVAGTMYRGQFEERIKKIVKEVKDNPNFIVFADELHTIIGAGSGEGTMDASNILKPALARGEFTCIGATTFDEYRKYIEKDSALERRFQKVQIDEPNFKDTVAILKGAAKSYEKFHGVTYSQEVIEAVVTLSNRYIFGRFQPDKGFDILDESGATVKLAGTKHDEDRDKLAKRIAAAKKDKNKAELALDFDEIARLKINQETLQFKLDKMKLENEDNSVTIEDIQAVVSAWSGIPVGDMSTSEKKALIEIEKTLSGIVVGQDSAVKHISNSLKKYKTPFKDPNRPMGGFIFVGPTGVGKSLLAKNIAKNVFGSASNFLQLDMSEYQDALAINKFVGGAAGYVGYDDSSPLLKHTSAKPYSVLLFDEIEKAHPSIHMALLQIMEDGKLTDPKGKVVDFKNTIIIMTSNVGVEAAKSMGFGSEAVLRERANGNILDELKKYFKPEFLGRFTTVLFNALTLDDARKVVDLEINTLNERISEYNFSIALKPKAVEFILSHGFNSKLGARNVRTQIGLHIEDALIDDFLKDKIKEKSVITFDVVDNKLTYSTKVKK